MKIRLFIFSCVLYFVILGAFVFHINSDPYTLEIASFSYTFSVAFWVVLPAFILFVFALLHMSFYGFLRYIKYKNFLLADMFYVKISLKILLNLKILCAMFCLKRIQNQILKLVNLNVLQSFACL